MVLVFLLFTFTQTLQRLLTLSGVERVIFLMRAIKRAAQYIAQSLLSYMEYDMCFVSVICISPAIDRYGIPSEMSAGITEIP